MDPNRPIVAQPGSATVTSVRRETDKRRRLRRNAEGAVRLESRRTTAPTPHRVFAGHTHDPRDAESLMKPEMAWCEQNCRGMWTIHYGSFKRGLGYTVRFGFTEAADAEAFRRYRQHRRDMEIVQFGGDVDR
jgi:hypothetical protein